MGSPDQRRGPGDPLQLQWSVPEEFINLQMVSALD